METKFQKIFDPAEANNLLPKLRKIISSILKNASEIRKHVKSDIDVGTQARIEGLDTEIRASIKQIESLGCYYKDWNFEMGLVDFPSRINGQLVFLCWRSDEDKISWYHPINEGYSSRMPLPSQILDE